MTFPLHVSVDRLAPKASRQIELIVSRAIPTVAPALALSVWHSGACWYDAHAGWLDPETAAQPVHGNALFDLASVSKLFTAAAFLQLASDGLVRLDQPVVEVIAGFGAGGPRVIDGGQNPLSRELLPAPTERMGMTVDPAIVTFGQLLTHTSGLAPWRAAFSETGPAPTPPGKPDPVLAEQRWEAGIKAVARYPFVADPGTEVRYSDLGFMILGEAVQQLSGLPFKTALKSLVTDRLDLEWVTSSPGRSSMLGPYAVASSFDGDWRGRRLRGEVEDENAAGLGGIGGHAGLFATARDLGRFGVAWLLRDPSLRLTPAIASAATTDQTANLGSARGLGWQVQPAGHLAPLGPRSFGHTGFTGTSLAVDPDRDLVVALLTNRVYAGRTHEGIKSLRTQLYGALALAFQANEA